MSDISRRELLRLAALGLGAAALAPVLAACKSLTPAAEPTSARPTSPASTEAGTQAPPTDLPSPTQLASSAPVSPGTRPDLVVARNGDPEQLVRRAVEALGGMALFVPRGTNVVVKPNVCVSYRTYEYAATTNPWVVGTLVKMAFEAGARSVSVFDNPFSGDAAEAYATSGIAEQVKAAGGQMVVMSGRKFVSTQIPAGKWLKQAYIYDDILKADVFINAPIAKDHSLARLTLGMKNLMGVVASPAEMHANLGQAIADLHTRIKPQLTVVDCVRILTRGGPEGGSLADVKKLDTVVASADFVAADSYVAGLFGLKPNDLDYVTAGATMGLGQSDLSKLVVQELSV